jgi:hypothetical protein
MDHASGRIEIPQGTGVRLCSIFVSVHKMTQRGTKETHSHYVLRWAVLSPGVYQHRHQEGREMLHGFPGQQCTSDPSTKHKMGAGRSLESMGSTGRVAKTLSL